jgi:DNA invertase Pin-like site-specific DNA recombinase
MTDQAPDPKQKMLFAPLVRVSMESQERQGESLRVQRDQLTRAVEALGGEVFRWYAGQEHGTPDHERRILEELMADAQERKLDAVMVADLSRWSRDNGKSKDYTKLLKKNGIQFFEGTTELDLFNPTHSFVLGMGVEVAEFFASQQSYKSILSRIARAKRGQPASGKLPYGRTFDKATGAWGIDEKKREKLQKLARIYLEADSSWNDLGPAHGMNGSNLQKILCHRCGDEWEQRFISKRHGIDETVITKVPRLLPEETIQAIRRKSEQRNSWDKKGQKHQYLFARVIFDLDTGKALTGTCNSMGKRYYKPYQGRANRYQVNADILEKAVLGELFQALGSKVSLHKAVFDGHPLGKVADKIKEGLGAKREELAQVEQRLESYATAIGTAADVLAFMARIKPKLVDLEARSKELKDGIAALEYRLATLPTDEEIEARHDEWAGLLRRGEMRDLETGAALHRLPFEHQKKIIRLIFGGRDETGRRHGIYVKDLGGTPKRYRFEAHGKLGAITGGVESRSGEYFSGSHELWRRDDDELGEGISRVMLNVNPVIFGEISDCKVDILSKRHAHHRQRLHQ